jgi:hypothetical protein
MAVVIGIRGAAIDPDEWLYATPSERADILARARADGFMPEGSDNLESGIPPRLIYVGSSFPVPSDPQITAGNVYQLGGAYQFGDGASGLENWAPGLMGTNVLSGGAGFSADPCAWLKSRGILPQAWKCSWIFIGLGIALAAGVVGGAAKRR